MRELGITLVLLPGEHRPGLRRLGRWQPRGRRLAPQPVGSGLAAPLLRAPLFNNHSFAGNNVDTSSSTSSSSRNHHTTQGFTSDAKFFYDCLIWEFCIVIANTTTPFANICCFSCHSVIMRSFCSKILLMCLLKMWSLKVSQ